MPRFEIEAADGRRFEVEAPDARTAANAIKKMSSPAPASPAPAEHGPATFSGAILPFSADAEGNTRFDSDAGIVGSLKRAFTLPGDVYAGRVDPRSDEAIGRSFDLAGAASPVNPGFRAGDMMIPGAARAPLRRADVVPPTGLDLKKEGSAGFERLEQMGVDYHPSAVGNRFEAVRADMEMKGHHADEAPQTFRILSGLQPTSDAVYAPLSELVRARKRLGNIAHDHLGKAEGRAAKTLQRQIDAFIQASDPTTVMAGPAPAAARELADANANFAAGSRSGVLTKGEKNAERRAVAANSGQNLENTIRRRAAWILDEDHPKRRSGFNATELAAIEAVNRGNTGRNTLRFVGNLLGGGGGLGMAASGSAAATAGAFIAGPFGAGVGGLAIPATGALLKKAATSGTRRALSAADELVRSRSPLYERMQAEAAMEPTPALRRAAMNRALLLMHEQEQFEKQRRAGRAT